jgi:DNA polymerase elongation subunit (family B)
VWERKDGKRDVLTFPAPYYFFTPHKDGEYKSIFDQKLMRHDFETYQEMMRAKQECESDEVSMFESDIQPELKVLSEHYYGKPAPNLHVTFLDIEVDYKPEIGFAGAESAEAAYAPINAMALYHNWNNRMIVYAVPPTDEWPDKQQFMKEIDGIAKLPSDCLVEIVFCKNELELLMNFLVEIEDSDVLCGWNSDAFDMPYIGRRLQKIGESYFKQLSFPLAPKPRWRGYNDQYGIDREALETFGRTTTDYMELFVKYEDAGRPSYKLETIAEEVLPDMLKLEYEGSLASLYVNDFARFVRYNLRDTEILKGFEDTLGYVSLANEMYHISTGDMRHVLGTLKLAELAINNYCIHELGVRVPNNIIDDDERRIQGAYVLVPRVNMHEWIGSMDINSLYPAAIRSINISPETLIGQFRECERAIEEIRKESMVTLSLEVDGEAEPIEQTADEWKTTLKENKWSVSGYGTVFDQAKQGVIPAILETWYGTRKQYQKKMREATNKDDRAYYDRLQYVYKIKLNSLYGALNNRFFRYYDLRMGESTTGTGRMILKHMCAQVCAELDGKYTMPNRKVVDKEGKVHWGYTDDMSVIYGDTDSTYFNTHASNIEEAILIADAVVEKVTNTFQQFMRDTFLCTEGFDDIVKAGREVVADRGIFVDKKRYILHLVDNEGESVDKLKVMGLDTKKTTLPAEVSKVLNHFVERLLKGEEWDVVAEDIVEYKERLRETKDVMMIGLPKGVKKVEFYTDQYNIYGDGVRLPGHVAAAIHYNQCLEAYEDHDNVPIISGMKIKVFYLTQKYGRFHNIALPTDTTKVPEWFLDHFSVDRDAHIERLVDNPLNNIIKAIGRETPSRQSLIVNELLDFE